MTARILFIAREFTAGGAAYLAVRHLQRLASDARRIDLLVTGPVAPALVGELPAGVTVHRLDVGPDPVSQGLLATREAVAAAGHPCLEAGYDAVVGSSLFPDLVACAAFATCRGRRKLLVLLDECLILPDLPADIRAGMQGAILAADHLLPVSQALLSTLGRSYPALLGVPATVIPPPIDEPLAERPSPFAGSTATGLPRLVTVARLSPEKQLGGCLVVHRQLRDHGVEFHWHVVGEGPGRAELEREIARTGMGDRFHLEGFQDDPRAWMRHADLFVLASRSEGCPTVIREALAEGTPVVATDVNGVRELVSDGVTGLVVADGGPALAAALSGLVADPAALRRLRDNLARQPQPATGDETARLAACLAGTARARPTPVVTILIPTHNHAAFIDRAIHSGLMQDFEALEVVVCDDASADETGLLARRHEPDPRFRYARRPTNLGRVANYRRAVEADASGEWVLVLDGDDHLTDPSFITNAMRVLAEHRDHEPLFVQAGHRVVRQPAAGRPDDAPHVDILPAISAESAVMTGGDYLGFVYETGFFTHLGTLYSRAAALRQGVYTSDISSADMDSLLRLALTGNVVVMKAIAGAWVQHGGNTSSNLPLERIEENVRIFRRIARAGAAAGVVDMAGLEDRLTRYEARTLAHLFGTAIGKSARGPLHALWMMGIMIRVNPRVCLEPELAGAWRRYAKRLTKMSLKRLEDRIKRAVAPVRPVRRKCA